jgi:hypothetical protein
MVGLAGFMPDALRRRDPLGSMLMSLYAWKITAAGKTGFEAVTSLGELEEYLRNSGLPGARPSKPLIEQTKLMQHEGQGVYKHNINGEQWTLLWIALR